MGSLLAASPAEEVSAVSNASRQTQTKEGKSSSGSKQKSQTPRSDGERPRRTNAAFNAFYKANLVDTGLISTDADWESFIDCLNRPLPSTLWITPTAKGASEVLSALQAYQRAAESHGENTQDGASKLQLRPLAWMPQNMGWCVNIPKAILRKDEQFKPLHSLLIEHTDKGTINRMEEVSMLPVAVLSVAAGHRCLDMCASPGNKTAQMLSQLAYSNFQLQGRGLEKMSSKEVTECQTVLQGRIDYSADEGFVIANDISAERSGMLVHQIARHQSLYPLVLFTSHDARFFPSIRSPDGTEIKFDRILCDVMCSSDGTLRKSPHLWRDWTPKLSLELHTDQLAVALRAARLLKVGGRMVYSTCSMSPIENEAVVAALLRCTKGALSLMDVRRTLDPFVTTEGLCQWQVAHPSNRQMFSSYSQVLEAGSAHKLIRPSNFPPPKNSAESLELSKCIRVLPHRNDTGGFFIAVFEKVSDLASKADGEELQRGYDSDLDADGEEVERERQLQRLEEAVATGRSEQERAKAISRRERAKSSGSLARELARYKPVATAMPDQDAALRSFYGLSPTFPMDLLACRFHLELDAEGQLVQTHFGEANQIIFFAKGTSDLLSWGTGDHAKRKLKVVAGGLRAFEKDRFGASGSSQFRLAQEAVEFLLPYLSQRVILLEEPADMRRLLGGSSRDAPTAALVSPGREQLEALTPGGCVLLLRTEHGDLLPVSALRTQKAVNLFINDLAMPSIRKACGLPAQSLDAAPAEGESKESPMSEANDD